MELTKPLRYGNAGVLHQLVKFSPGHAGVLLTLLAQDGAVFGNCLHAFVAYPASTAQLGVEVALYWGAEAEGGLPLFGDRVGQELRRLIAPGRDAFPEFDGGGEIRAV